MKKFIILCSFLGLLLLIGCTEQDDVNKENVNLGILELEQKIQDLSLYEPLTEEDKNRLSDCNKIILGSYDKIKKLNVYKSGRFDLNILSIPGLQDISMYELNKKYVEHMCDGAGQQEYLLTLDEHLLTWDLTGCGFEIGELWENETEESKECAIIRDNLSIIHENAIEEWKESKNFDDLSFCGEFIRDDTPQGMNKYLFCRNKWDGECYYKHITYAETMGCYFDEDDSRDTPFECMESWTTVYDSEGNIKQEKVINRNLPQDDYCEPTNQEIFEQKVN